MTPSPLELKPVKTSSLSSKVLLQRMSAAQLAPHRPYKGEFPLNRYVVHQKLMKCCMSVVSQKNFFKKILLFRRGLLLFKSPVQIMHSSPSFCSDKIVLPSLGSNGDTSPPSHQIHHF